MILAIDPGPTQSAWLLYDEQQGKPLRFGIFANPELLRTIYEYPWEVNQLAIEMIGHYGTGLPAGKTVFHTCVWIGRFIEAFSLIAETYLLHRKTIVTHLTGTVKANDGNVRQALIDRFGPPGTKKNPGVLYGISKDVWSALAIAVTFADRGEDCVIKDVIHA